MLNHHLNNLHFFITAVEPFNHFMHELPNPSVVLRLLGLSKELDWALKTTVDKSCRSRSTTYIFIDTSTKNIELFHSFAEEISFALISPGTSFSKRKTVYFAIVNELGYFEADFRIWLLQRPCHLRRKIEKGREAVSFAYVHHLLRIL